MSSDMVDYMGNQHDSLKKKNDADVEWLLGEVNTAHYEGQQITATNTLEGRSKSAILKGQTEKFIGFEIGTYDTNTFEKSESQNRIRSIGKFNGYDETTIRCKSGYEAYLIIDAQIAHGWSESLTVNTTGREFVVLFRRKNN